MTSPGSEKAGKLGGWMPDIGYWILDLGYQIPDARY
jgi:hypothetical protein